MNIIPKVNNNNTNSPKSKEESLNEEEEELIKNLNPQKINTQWIQVYKKKYFHYLLI